MSELKIKAIYEASNKAILGFSGKVSELCVLS
jgi:hypothetical protein